MRGGVTKECKIYSAFTLWRIIDDMRTCNYERTFIENIWNKICGNIPCDSAVSSENGSLQVQNFFPTFLYLYLCFETNFCTLSFKFKYWKRFLLNIVSRHSKQTFKYSHSQSISTCQIKLLHSLMVKKVNFVKNTKSVK